MLRNLNVTSGGRRILGVPTVGTLAATIAAETASGTSGPGLLYDEASNPANAGKQLRIRITSLPGSGTLFVYENGAFDFSGAANGTHTIGYNVDADDAFLRSDTATIIVGAAPGAAPGATLTGTSSLTASAATGGASAINGSAPGATLSGTSSLTAGTATGGGGATGSFATAALENNTGAGLLVSTAVEWTLYYGTIGSAPTAMAHGSGTTNGSGVLSGSGVPLGAADLWVRTPDGTGIYYRRVTVA